MQVTSPNVETETIKFLQQLDPRLRDDPHILAIELYKKLQQLTGFENTQYYQLVSRALQLVNQCLTSRSMITGAAGSNPMSVCTISPVASSSSLITGPASSPELKRKHPEGVYYDATAPKQMELAMSQPASSLRSSKSFKGGRTDASASAPSSPFTGMQLKQLRAQCYVCSFFKNNRTPNAQLLDDALSKNSHSQTRSMTLQLDGLSEAVDPDAENSLEFLKPKAKRVSRRVVSSSPEKSTQDCAMEEPCAHESSDGFLQQKPAGEFRHSIVAKPSMVTLPYGTRVELRKFVTQPQSLHSVEPPHQFSGTQHQFYGPSVQQQTVQPQFSPALRLRSCERMDEKAVQLGSVEAHLSDTTTALNDGHPQEEDSKPQCTIVDAWVFNERLARSMTERLWEQKLRKTEELVLSRHRQLNELGLKTIMNTGEDEAMTKNMIELKKVKCLHLQQKLRRDLVNDFFRVIGPEMAALRSVKMRCSAKWWKQFEQKQKEHKLRRQKEMEEWNKARRDRCKRSNRYVREYHKRKERLYREQFDKTQREKINLLKNNDVEGYLRMVKDTKSDRVQKLLSETERYLEKLGTKLRKQKECYGEGDTSQSVISTNATIDQAKHYLENNEKYYLLAHSIKEDIHEQPRMLQGGCVLGEYQMNGLRWLVSLYKNHLNGILADEMGLGKTVQVIALICYLMETKLDHGPFLVVVPSSVLPNWMSELSRWAPSITKLAYRGTPEERRLLLKNVSKQQQFNVLITTYEFLMSKADRPRLSKILWHYIIMDEGHRIKNAACKLNAELKHYESNHRLLLTGTPIQNNLDELWSLLNFLLPTIFDSSENFAQWFNKPFEGFADDPSENVLTEEENLLIINRLHQVLRPFVLRRLKHKVANELPEKIERLVRCEASAYQKLLIKRVTEKTGGIGRAKARSVHNTVMELRNICNHPYLSHVHTEEAENLLMDHYLPNVVRLCGKLETLDRLLPKLKATNHRVLLFSTMTRMLDVLEDYLAWKGYVYLRLDGHTAGEDRGALIDEFNSADSTTFLFLLSIRAGGVGVNLQAADTVIIYDTDWNPQVDLQAQARAHRIGQKRDVLVLRLETVNSIEQQVRASAEQKLGVANQSITAGFFDNDTSAEDRREYLESLLRESKEEEVDAVPGDDELNYLLARRDDEVKTFEAVDKTRKEEDETCWSMRRHKSSGGLLPPRLVTDEDLKPVLSMIQEADTSRRKTDLSETQRYGRGKRSREAPSYKEPPDDDLEQEREQEQGRVFRRSRRKTTSDANAIADDETSAKRGCRRPRKYENEGHVNSWPAKRLRSARLNSDKQNSGSSIQRSTHETATKSVEQPSSVNEVEKAVTAAVEAITVDERDYDEFIYRGAETNEQDSGDDTEFTIIQTEADRAL